MIEWNATSLVDDLARRRCVLVIGSGVSRHSIGKDGTRPPVWKEFLEQSADKCPEQPIEHIRKAIAEHDFLHACEWLKKRFDEGWTNHLRNTFQTPKFKPSNLHDAIIALDARVVFSLNFDDIFERSTRDGEHIVKQYYDSDFSEFLRGDKRYIVKVHGSLNSPQNLIFTQNDYAKARAKHSSFYEAFDACLMTNTFLFIGTGIDDPDVNLILENQNFGFPSTNPHYFLSGSPLNGDLIESLRRNRNLKIIQYDPIDIDHSGLVAEINNLVGLVEGMREDMGLQASW